MPLSTAVKAVLSGLYTAAVFRTKALYPEISTVCAEATIGIAVN